MDWKQIISALATEIRVVISWDDQNKLSLKEAEDLAGRTGSAPIYKYATLRALAASLDKGYTSRIPEDFHTFTEVVSNIDREVQTLAMKIEQHAHRCLRGTTIPREYFANAARLFERKHQTLLSIVAPIGWLPMEQVE